MSLHCSSALPQTAQKTSVGFSDSAEVGKTVKFPITTSLNYPFDQMTDILQLSLLFFLIVFQKSYMNFHPYPLIL